MDGLSGLQRLTLGLGLDEALQHRDEQDAHENTGEAAVIQAEATVQTGYQRHKAVVDHGSHKAILPAVLIRDGGYLLRNCD